MAGPDDDDQVTRDMAEDPEEAALREELIQMLKGADTLPGDTEETDGLLAPMDEPDKGKTMVSVEDGMERAEKARSATGKTVADAQADDIDAQIAAKPADAVDDTTAKPAPALAAPAADIALLLEGIDEPKRVAIQARIEAGQDVLQHFANREEELAIHGNPTPGQAVERLLHLNEFAQSKPDEYMAWLSLQTNGAAPQDVLGAAAKHLGYKLVPDSDPDDGDEFDDENTKALKAELKALKSDKTAFGPDAPQNVAAMTVRRELGAYRNAKDENGQPKHPLADKYFSEVAAKVQEWRGANGDKIPTAADLSRFYFEVAPALPGGQPAPAATTPAAPAQTNAAQAPAAVPEKTQKAATPARSAEAASKLLDGSGPGADRRPAQSTLTGDALLRNQIAESMREAKGN